MAHWCNEILYRNQEEQTETTCSNINKSQESNVEWEKYIAEEHIEDELIHTKVQKSVQK